jgi:hypothetical protein
VEFAPITFEEEERDSGEEAIGEDEDDKMAEEAGDDPEVYAGLHELEKLCEHLPPSSRTVVLIWRV